jgi:hypothetical protein
MQIISIFPSEHMKVWLYQKWQYLQQYYFFARIREVFTLLFLLIRKERLMGIISLFYPLPQKVVWTHHAFIVSYSMFQLIEPSLGI